MYKSNLKNKSDKKLDKYSIDLLKNSIDLLKKPTSPHNSNIYNFNPKKTMILPKNENMSYFLLKKSKISFKPKENYEIHSFQKKNSYLEGEFKYNFRKFSDFSSKIQEFQKKQNFFLKNDYLQVPNRVFLNKKIGQVDQNLINSMVKLSKSMVPKRSPIKYKSVNEKIAISSKKQDFSPELASSNGYMINDQILDKNTNTSTIIPKKISKNLERQEKIKKLLNQSVSPKIKEIQKVLKSTKTINKKVSFNV